MKTYRVGETVTCKATIQKSSVNYDPTTDVVIYIYKVGTATPLVDGVTMLPKESVGVYVYDYQATVAAKYRWTCKATDGTKIAKEDSAFEVIA